MKTKGSSTPNALRCGAVRCRSGVNVASVIYYCDISKQRHYNIIRNLNQVTVNATSVIHQVSNIFQTTAHVADFVGDVGLVGSGPVGSVQWNLAIYTPKAAYFTRKSDSRPFARRNRLR